MINLLFAGDFCPQNRVLNSLKNDPQNTFAFNDLKIFTKLSKYSCVNLEVACTEDTKSRIFKHGPNLSAPLASIDYLKDMGFNMVAMANNHILNFGSESLKEAISRCEEIGIDYVGAGMNFGEAEETLIKKVKDKKVAFINCCEHELLLQLIQQALTLYILFDNSIKYTKQSPL